MKSVLLHKLYFFVRFINTRMFAQAIIIKGSIAKYWITKAIQVIEDRRRIWNGKYVM